MDIQAIVRQAVQEFVNNEQAKTEPAHKAELQEERKRREQLERRLNELVEENKRSRKMAAEAERGATVRAELQRLGVAKIDLAFRAVQDGIVRTEDGRLVARGEVHVGRRAHPAVDPAPPVDAHRRPHPGNGTAGSHRVHQANPAVRVERGELA